MSQTKQGRRGTLVVFCERGMNFELWIFLSESPDYPKEWCIFDAEPSGHAEYYLTTVWNELSVGLGKIRVVL